MKRMRRGRRKSVEKTEMAMSSMNGGNIDKEESRLIRGRQM